MENMPKKRESRELEWYQGEIRRLESSNKALRKRLRQLEKSKHVYKELKLDEEANQEVERDEALKSKEPRLEICDNCFRRGLEEIRIVNRKFKSCTLCNWRSKAVVVEHD